MRQFFIFSLLLVLTFSCSDKDKPDSYIRMTINGEEQEAREPSHYIYNYGMVGFNERFKDNTVYYNFDITVRQFSGAGVYELDTLNSSKYGFVTTWSYQMYSTHSGSGFLNVEHYDSLYASGEFSFTAYSFGSQDSLSITNGTFKIHSLKPDSTPQY